MCFAALVQQDVFALARHYGAAIDWTAFEDLFRRRVTDLSLKIPRALEANFVEPTTPEAFPIKQYIEQYREAHRQEWERKSPKEEARIAEAQRKLAKRDSESQRKELKVATNNIEKFRQLIADLGSPPSDRYGMVSSNIYAPVILTEQGRRLIRPMRYLCRLEGASPSWDEKYPGTYNARRDSLKSVWRNVYRKRHAITDSKLL